MPMEVGQEEDGPAIGGVDATPFSGEDGEASASLPSTTTAITLPVEGVEGLIPLCVQHLKGPHQTTATFGYDIAQMEHRPWAKPTAKKSDYFNYGFDEPSWRLYCALQVEGQESLVQRAREVLQALQVGATMSPMMLHGSADHSPPPPHPPLAGGPPPPLSDTENGGGRPYYPPLPGPPPPTAYPPHGGGLPYAFSLPSHPPGDGRGGPSAVGEEGSLSAFGYPTSHGIGGGGPPGGDHGLPLLPTDPNSSPTNLGGGGGEDGRRGGGGRPHWIGSTGSSAGGGTSGSSSHSTNGGGVTPHRFYKTQMCKDFLEGRCFRGAACHYAHGEEELRAAPAGVLAGHPPPPPGSGMGGGPALGVGMDGGGGGRGGGGGGAPLRAMKRPRPEFSPSTKGRH